MAAVADVQIPSKYKAIIYDEPGKLSTKIVDLDMPEPGPGEVLIHITHSGVCHSDFGVMTNSWSILPFPTQPGQVGGHEGVGEIVKLGAGAEANNVKVGDRVGVKWIAGICGNCPACLEGVEGVCFNAKVSGYYTPGTFQQYVLGPANYVTPIPDGLDSAAAAPMLCGGVTVYSALRKCGAVSGQWVVIYGAGGGLGHLAVQTAAKGMGFRVIGIDHSSKKQLALDSGAEHFFGFDTSGDKLVDDVKEATGGLGARGVIVCTASNAAYDSAVGMLSFRGTLVCVGIPEGEPIPIKGAMAGQLLAKEMRIVGSAIGTRKEAIECLDLAKRGIVKMHYKTEKAESLTSVFQDMEHGKLQGRVVLDLTQM